MRIERKPGSNTKVEGNKQLIKETGMETERKAAAAFPLSFPILLRNLSID